MSWWKTRIDVDLGLVGDAPGQEPAPAAMPAT